MTMIKEIRCDLREIPGVGKNIEQDLRNIGIRTIEDLKGRERK
ncbi:helix-hairpin-helix domain-containing protein [Luxibacter massiliensis]|nr:helix-hairpin-helix domain-containing protein [Luxibacter massiliensis]